MDNEKRVLLAIVLSIAVLFVYQSYFTPAPTKRLPETQQSDQVLQPRPIEKTAPDIMYPGPKKLEKITSLSNTDTGLTEVDGKLVSVFTNMYSALFESNTSRIKSFTLHKYKDKISSPPVIKFIRRLIFSETREEQSDISDAYNDKEMIQLHRSIDLPLRTTFLDSNGTVHGNGSWYSDKENLHPGSIEPKCNLTFTQETSDGLNFKKRFTFIDNEYRIDFAIVLSNKSNDTRVGNTFVEWKSFCPEKSGGGFLSGGATANVSRFTYLINGKVEKKELHDIKEQIILEGDFGWTAIEEKYFISAIIPRTHKPVQVRLMQTSDNTIAYGLMLPHVVLNPGSEISYSFSLYLGPLNIDVLKKQDANLEKAIDFGFFDIIAKPLLLSLIFCYKFLGNYGLAIILITIIIKILFWPLTNKSMKSMKGMQSIQPEIAKLKEKHKGNKEEFAKQQMGLYKKYKVNPLGGCLPMILQIPVFIALYRVLGDSIELRHANFISFWINDLSAKDPTYVAPILMGLSMLIQQKMTPTAVDPAQAKMMMFMPIIFTVMFLSFPSGLVIYWFVNNVLSIAQQIYINKKTNVGDKGCSPSKQKQKPLKKQSQ